jgi:hypothetical protein
VRKERFCVTHREEKVRFFCTQCSAVICRDCKLTSHDGYATVDLGVKSSEARGLIQEVTAAAKSRLEPQLRSILLEAEYHREGLQGKKHTILATLTSRADELKAEIDRSLQKAMNELSRETSNLDATAAKCIDGMNQQLACFLSLTEHAQNVAQTGCDADVLEMPSQLKQFFGSPGQSLSDVQFGRSPQPRQQWPKPTYGMGCRRAWFGGASYPKPAVYNDEPLEKVDDWDRDWGPVHQQQQPAVNTQTCKLSSFTDESWRFEIQLNNNAPGPQHAGNVHDAKSAIQNAIPQYLGSVTRNECRSATPKKSPQHQQQESWYQLERLTYVSDYSKPHRGGRGGGRGGSIKVPPRPNPPPPASASPAGTIEEEIRNIQNMLSRWQSA